MLDSNLTVAWFESWTAGIAESVALAATATLGYLIARRPGRRLSSLEADQARQELERAALIAQNLEAIAAELRSDLAAHHGSITQFKAKVAQMVHDEAPASCKALYEEAERVLAPTLKLAAVLSHAYDRIRKQSAQLMTFTEGRTDPLTGTNNRRALDEQLDLLFEVLCRDGRPFSLAIFDIDHFKTVNDEHGFPFGDQVLQDVAHLFEQSVRESDFVARYGGEEFVVVMPQTRLPGASVFAERLRSLVEQKLSVTVSGGIAEAAAQDTIQSVLSRTDSALYSAKAAGRNAVYQHNGAAIRPVAKQEPKLQTDALDDMAESEAESELADLKETTLLSSFAATRPMQSVS